MTPTDNQDAQEENTARLLFRLLVLAEVIGALVLFFQHAHF